LRTKKKAADIFYSKVVNEDRLRDRLKINTERALHEQQMRLKVFHMREMARREAV
jgi:hypothetical protein